MNKFWNHLRTVQKHRKEVRKLCFKCGLYWQGLTHDLSKYSPVEFFPSVKYYNGNHSPIDDEIKEKGFSKCWMHHFKTNKHHFSYWVDIEHRLKASMPYKYIIEMFCDRVAACKIYLKDNYTDEAPLNYLKDHDKESKEFMDKDTYNILYSLLNYLYFHGIDKTCSFIKENIKYMKRNKDE